MMPSHPLDKREWHNQGHPTWGDAKLAEEPVALVTPSKPVAKRDHLYDPSYWEDNMDYIANLMEADKKRINPLYKSI